VLRYYAIATVIVLAIAVVATAWSNRDFMRFHMGRTEHASAPPQHVSSSQTGGAVSQAFRGDAEWALSALPECFIQRSESTGSIAYVRARIAADAQPVASGTRLEFGPCTIFVHEGEVLVDRGMDRMRIPPEATLYRTGASLQLLRTTGSTAVLRTYEIVTKK
jgi:hypothetical protein